MSDVETLTRGEALDMIDAAMERNLAAPDDESCKAAVLKLQLEWIGHGQHLHEDTAETLADRLREYVAECAMNVAGDDIRSNGPKDSDDTGIPA